MGIYLPLIHGVTPKNSPALRKKIIRSVLFFALFAAVIFAAVNFLLAQESPSTQGAASSSLRWYRSNASGMALEQVASRLAALRNEYSLSVETINPDRLPRILPNVIRPYYDNSYRVELRILYKEGSSFRQEEAEVRRQWIFRDSRGMTVIAASGNRGFFEENTKTPGGEGDEEEEESEEIKISGFIEIRNSGGYVTRELQFDEDLSEWDFRYFYRNGILLRTETWFKGAPLPVSAPEVIPKEETVLAEDEDEDVDYEEGAEASGEAAAEAVAEAVIETIVQQAPIVQERKEPVLELTFTDYYRYTRSGSIRAIDRIIHETAGGKSRVAFPRLGPGVSLGEELVSQDSAYTAGYFMGVSSPEGSMISYSLDSRGRILGEVWKDEDGKIVGELKNTWSGERLQSVSWKSKDEDKLIEYEYDNRGNPTAERNFSFGVLERSVTYEDGRETEDIYMNGRLILRAYWENGIKVKEERVFSSGGGSR